MLATFLNLLMYAFTFGPFTTGYALENIALGKEAKQSTTHFHWSAKYAVDGIETTAFPTDQECASTDDSPHTVNPWWMVDLGNVSVVHDVNIQSRPDCCQERLKNFTIQMSQSIEEDGITLLNPSLCFQYYPNITPAGWTKFSCPGATYARYIKVQLHLREGVLTLCEVQVWGEKAALPYPQDLIQYKMRVGKKSPAMVIKEFQTTTEPECFFNCSDTMNCHSVNIKQLGDSFTCQLLEDIKEMKEADVINETGWTYYRPNLEYERLRGCLA